METNLSVNKPWQGCHITQDQSKAIANTREQQGSLLPPYSPTFLHDTNLTHLGTWSVKEEWRSEARNTPDADYSQRQPSIGLKTSTTGCLPLSWGLSHTGSFLQTKKGANSKFIWDHQPHIFIQTLKIPGKNCDGPSLDHELLTPALKISSTQMHSYCEWVAVPQRKRNILSRGMITLQIKGCNYLTSWNEICSLYNYHTCHPSPVYWTPHLPFPIPTKLHQTSLQNILVIELQNQEL
jgi:hypothetical protein